MTGLEKTGGRRVAQGQENVDSWGTGRNPMLYEKWPFSKNSGTNPVTFQFWRGCLGPLKIWDPVKIQKNLFFSKIFYILLNWALFEKWWVKSVDFYFLLLRLLTATCTTLTFWDGSPWTPWKAWSPSPTYKLISPVLDLDYNNHAKQLYHMIMSIKKHVRR